MKKAALAIVLTLGTSGAMAMNDDIAKLQFSTDVATTMDAWQAAVDGATVFAGEGTRGWC